VQHELRLALQYWEKRYRANARAGDLMWLSLDRSFVFAADLIRHIAAPVVCHFVREDVRDVHQGGHTRREVLFGSRPDLKGRDVLLVDAVLESGVTQEFLLRRLGEGKPRSIRLRFFWTSPRSAACPGAGLLWLPDGI